MQLDSFLQQLSSMPENITFDDTIAVIDAIYNFDPTAFSNGDLVNKAGQNQGSCKIFAFARLRGLSQQQTLHCFGSYYRDDVLKHPNRMDHRNIRNFMKHGWSDITFDSMPLKLKVNSPGQA